MSVNTHSTYIKPLSNSMGPALVDEQNNIVIDIAALGQEMTKVTEEEGNIVYTNYNFSLIYFLQF